jgi:cellobiose-specific phosphotransferase system component IIC
MVRTIFAFAVAAVFMTLAGSAAHSWFVQQAWIDASALSVPTAALNVEERIAWMLDDVVGMLPQYGGLTAVALLIAFLAAHVVARVTGLRTIVFSVAGAVAIFVMFTLMKEVLGTVGVFGARGTAGLAAQSFAGLLSGFLFAMLTRRNMDS